MVQVTGSPLATKRSFLERKGLTAAEIEEALRRVPADALAPAPPPALAPAAPTAAAAPPSTAVAPYNPQATSVVAAAAPPPPQQGLRWSQVG